MLWLGSQGGWSAGGEQTGADTTGAGAAGGLPMTGAGVVSATDGGTTGS